MTSQTNMLQIARMHQDAGVKGREFVPIIDVSAPNWARHHSHYLTKLACPPGVAILERSMLLRMTVRRQGAR